jgi:subfamily B ATP-binding cassette protein HlyB/CyaB
MEVLRNEAEEATQFGFRWFIPELLKHRAAWRDVLLASLLIQLIGLATPLITQAVLDKVVVHGTISTLLALGSALLVFAVFSAALGWARQRLMLEVGNIVDLSLGVEVCRRLFRLHPLYFQSRSTGVIAARLQGVEAIREFISGTALSLLLDLPFLVVFVSMMLFYSVPLTMLVLVTLLLICSLSALVSPIFQIRLQQQFHLGARNQAMLTEMVAGVETVKTLQMEDQIDRRYEEGLRAWLSAGMAARSLGNAYHTACSFLEQLLSLSVLCCGAWLAIEKPSFTIGMLVAFQMCSSRLSQPLLRLTGLWQQFQQARLAVQRLGDLMDAPMEPYARHRTRELPRRGAISFQGVSFRYDANRPLLYENLSLDIAPGSTVAIVGPSGCGKSTLARMLQGFCHPSTGRILIDGLDTRHLCTQELRSQLGVVPQSTLLFSGTVLDNLLAAQPQASFEDVVAACSEAEIHEHIQSMPNGYQTELGERGQGLSGGQMQRIAIARALLKRPSVLILDEATSALDAITAARIARVINSLQGRITTIFISHGSPHGLRVDRLVRIPDRDMREEPWTAGSRMPAQSGPADPDLATFIPQNAPV